MVDAPTIGLVASSSVLAAILTQGSSIVRDWLKRRRDAAFSALSAAMTLEAFARSCSGAISESETFEASSGSDGAPHSRIPKGPEFSVKLDWDVLGISFTAECLAMAIEIESDNGGIAAEFDYVDDEAGIFAMRRATVRFGLAAYDLAKRLRAAFRVEPLKLGVPYSFVSYLAERRDAYALIAKELQQAEKHALDEVDQPAGAI